jgi:hypothetical protein
LGAVACGNSDSDSEGSAGERGVSDDEEQLAELEAELARLRAELETAGQDARAELEQQIADLEDQIADLKEPGCGEGGECVGIATTVSALEPIFEAYCGQLYGCCTTGQTALALGLAVDDAAACTTALVNRAERGLDTFDLAEGFYQTFGFELPDVALLASKLEAGRISLDEEKIAACAAELNALECGEYGGYPYGYGGPSASCEAASACDWPDWVIGLVEEGGECDGSYAYGFPTKGPSVGPIDECVGGLSCNGAGGVGLCVRDGAEGDRCFNNDDCSYYGPYSDSATYCDTTLGECVPRVEEGEKCSFLYAWSTSQYEVTTPCAPGLECNVFSLTCEAPCSEGAHCSYSGQCPEGTYCEADPDGSKGPYYGSCAEDDRKAEGASCSGGEECSSEICADTDHNASGECARACSEEADCAAGWHCYDGWYCREDFAVGEGCGGFYGPTSSDPYCGEDATCVKDDGYGYGYGDGWGYGTCWAKATEPDEDCPQGIGRELASTFCDDGQFCDDGTCVDELDLAADCDGYYSYGGTPTVCGPDAFCGYDSESADYRCLPTLARGEACGGANYEGCAAGLDCYWYDEFEEGATVGKTACLPPTERAAGEWACSGTSPDRDCAAVCATGRASDFTVSSFCVTGLSTGANCNAEQSWNANSLSYSANLDGCNVDAYCKLTDPAQPSETADYAGKCSARIPAGGICDASYPSYVPQCEDDLNCVEIENVFRCRAAVTAEESYSCPIESYNGAYWVSDDYDN